MRKKIYTFTFILFAISLSLYLVWAIAANVQKESFRRYLNEEWSLNLIDESITMDGFPFKFGMKVSNFRSSLKHIPLSLQFLKLEIVRLIYNFSDVILFVENPIVTSTDYPKFNSSANKLKVSISNKPFSGRYKLITEQEDWQISDDRNNIKLEAKKVIFALKDVGKTKLDFYLQANDLRSSFLNNFQEIDSEESTEFIVKGTISDKYMSNRKVPYQAIKLESIMMEQVDINIGVLRLVCNDMVLINLIEVTTEGNIDCLLRLSSKNISQIKTNNGLIKSILDLINLILIVKDRANIAEPQVVPLKFSLDKGLLYINAIPIYQFPKKY
ncbi:DUF2125 domain-containing protein [Paracoccaceae bacterium]|nr:DUF2125 domain-containing protein [Paracoccaceae bacterium]